MPSAFFTSNRGIRPSIFIPSWVPDFAHLAQANPHMFLRNESALPHCASGDTKQQIRFSSNYKVPHILGKILDAVNEVAYGAKDSQQNKTPRTLMNLRKPAKLFPSRNLWIEQ